MPARKLESQTRFKRREPTKGTNRAAALRTCTPKLHVLRASEAAVGAARALTPPGLRDKTAKTRSLAAAPDFPTVLGGPELPHKAQLSPKKLGPQKPHVFTKMPPSREQRKSTGTSFGTQRCRPCVIWAGLPPIGRRNNFDATLP